MLLMIVWAGRPTHFAARLFGSLHLSALWTSSRRGTPIKNNSRCLHTWASYIYACCNPWRLTGLQPWAAHSRCDLGMHVWQDQNRIRQWYRVLNKAAFGFLKRKTNKVKVMASTHQIVTNKRHENVKCSDVKCLNQSFSHCLRHKFPRQNSVTETSPVIKILASSRIPRKGRGVEVAIHLRQSFIF